MAKQEKLDFDYEEYFDSILETTAILMWSTRHEAYTFAFYLNQLYNMNLERRDNIKIERKSGDLNCSIFHHQSNLKRYTYILVDNGNVQPTAKKNATFFDKTLFIMGEEARSTAQRIYDEIQTGDSTLGGFSDPDRDEMLKSFINSGILECALFDFSDPETPFTSYFPETQASETLEKKRQKFLREQRLYITDLFLAIDSLLPDYESVEL